MTFKPSAKHWFRITGRILVTCFCLASLAGCGEQKPLTSKISLLFIGNSFTYVNNLPGTFAQLALSGGHPVTTGMIAPGAYKLYQHAATPFTMKTIQDQKWDYVVLQEQSQVPSIPFEKVNEMYPAVRSMNIAIRQTGALPVLYMTWGRKNGCPEIGYSDYLTMQDQLTQGYMDIANELAIEVSPVGEAWRNAVALRPSLDLWGGDGIHPGPAGTYLAACVFYATIYQESPKGLKYMGDLDYATGDYLQGVADQTVLTDLKRWNIPTKENKPK